MYGVICVWYHDCTTIEYVDPEKFVSASSPVKKFSECSEHISILNNLTI